MKDREFDDIIRKLSDITPNEMPNWPRLRSALSLTMPIEDENNFDKDIQGTLDQLSGSSSPKWQHMSGMLDDQIDSFDHAINEKLETYSPSDSKSDWSKMQSSLDDLDVDAPFDRLIAASMLSFSPEGEPNWHSLDKELDHVAQTQSSDSLFDQRVRSAIAHLNVSQDSDWTNMKFALDSDALLGDNAAFDEHIKNYGTRNTEIGNKHWSWVKNRLDLQDARQRRIALSKALEISLFLIIMVLLPLTWQPKEEEKQKVLDTNRIYASTDENEETQGLATNYLNLSTGNNEMIQYHSHVAVNGDGQESATTIKEESSTLRSVRNTSRVEQNPQVRGTDEKPTIMASRDDGKKAYSISELSSQPIVSLIAEDEHDLSSIESLPNRNLLVTRGLTNDEFALKIAPTAHSLARNGMAIMTWRPYASAGLTMNHLEVKLSNLDLSKELIERPKWIPTTEFGVGLSNKKWDIETGVSRLRLTNLPSDTTYAEIADNEYVVTLNRDLYEHWSVPIRGRLHLPIQNRVNLFVELGLNANWITESPQVRYSDKETGQELPEGGPLRLEEIYETDKELKDFYLHANIGMGISYSLSDRLRFLAYSRMMVPFSEGSFSETGDSWDNIQVGLGAQYFLR